MAAFKARADNHVALRVSDMDSLVRFYEQALGGTVQTVPVVVEGRFIEDVMGAGTRVKVCHVGFDGGAALELWEFLEPACPIPASDQRRDGLMHFSFTVEDVGEALGRVEAAGGRRRFEIRSAAPGGPEFVYCEDPDGHVFELVDADHDDLVARMIAAQPSLAP